MYANMQYKYVCVQRCTRQDISHVLSINICFFDALDQTRSAHCMVNPRACQGTHLYICAAEITLAAVCNTYLRKNVCRTVPEAHAKEFSSMINFLLREDKASEAVATFVCIINEVLVQRRRDPLASIRPSPPDGLVYRGGGMEKKYLSFFTQGKKYRVPGFLATSFDKNIAKTFWERAVMYQGVHAVLWTIKVTAACMHVNYVKNTHVANEQEYLFTPYSPFQVIKVSCCWGPIP
jgi:hypothetical protein